MTIKIKKIKDEEINLGLEFLESLYLELGEESESIKYLSETFLKSILESGKTEFYFIDSDDVQN